MMKEEKERENDNKGVRSRPRTRLCDWSRRGLGREGC